MASQSRDSLRPGAPAGAGTPGPHRFTREKILDLISEAMEISGGLVATKRELAERCGCVSVTVDLAVKGLRRSGQIEVLPQFDECGGQVANVYRISVR